MKQTVKNPTKGQSLKKEKQSTNVFSQKELALKEGTTAKGVKLQIERAKRKATNEAGNMLVSDMREMMHEVPIILQIFKASSESVNFCQRLTEETGKVVTVETIAKIPYKTYLDYVTELEATRQHMRGITLPEFKNIMLRLHRKETKGTVMSEDARAEILRQYTRNTEI